MTDDIAVRLAKAAAAGGPDPDAPPLLVLGEGDDKVPEVFGTVVGRGTGPCALLRPGDRLRALCVRRL